MKRSPGPDSIALNDEEENLLENRDDNTKKELKRAKHDFMPSKLIFCSLGIYTSYLIYGSLQEDVYTYVSTTIASDPKFRYIWFVQTVEALINTLTSFVGHRMSSTDRRKRKQRPFYISGFSQVSSKFFTSLALGSGLSFPVATLAKSGKMAPVMIGQFALGNTKYTIREYIQVGMIIVGTAILGLSKTYGENISHSSKLGLTYIILSLVMDGVTGGKC